MESNKPDSFFQSWQTPPFSYFVSQQGEADIAYRVNFIDSDLLMNQTKNCELEVNLCGKILTIKSPLLNIAEVVAEIQKYSNKLDKVAIEAREDLFSLSDFENNVHIAFIPEPKLEIRKKINISFNSFASFSFSFSTVLIHSAGIIRKNKAALFLAEDGGGKTTIAKLVEQNAVLSDDQVAIRKEGNTFFAHSTPWGRIVNGPQAVPLGALFKLEKSQKFSIELISSKLLIAFIWDELSNSTCQLPLINRIAAFNLISDIVHAVPCFRVNAPLDGIDLEQIDSCI